MFDRIEMLERENERLRERVAELERERGSHLVFPRIWRLTPSEERILALLLSRDMATKDALLTELRDPTCLDEEPDIKIVDVLICKIRKKMKPFGLSIETLWGRGYRIVEPIRADFARQVGMEGCAR